MKATKPLAFACLLAGAAAHAQTCPEKAPDGLRVTPVADRVFTQGLVMAVAQVDGKEAPEPVLARTAEKWKQDGFDVRRSTTPGWDIVAAKTKGCLVTLQLAKRPASFGYLARSTDGQGNVPTAVQRGVKLPPDAQVESSVASVDDGRESLVLNIRSNRSLDELNKFFLNELAAADWQAVRSHRIMNDKTRTESLFVTAQKDRHRVEIVIWPERGSQIVMTISEAI